MAPEEVIQTVGIGEVTCPPILAAIEPTSVLTGGLTSPLVTDSGKKLRSGSI